MTKPVEIVTITKIVPIFKDTTEANAINVINFSFENGDECGYNVVAQKGLYELGDRSVYIQPDFCLPDISLFESFIRPNGEPNKSRLGKSNRIRAIKFNFQFENDTNPIYSFGILMPIPEVEKYLGRHYDETNLEELLGITKYEEPEKSGHGLSKDFPSFLYKTDEENMMNLKSKVGILCDGETEFGATLKTDGSSISIYFKKDEVGVWTHGVCSRALEKKTDQSYISQYSKDDLIFTKYLNPDTKQMGWKCESTDVFYTDSEILNTDLTPTKTEIRDSWVELANKTGIVERGLMYCRQHDTQLAFRGEIYGQGLKGSGNKYNPDATKKQGIMLFGLDCIDTGFSMRQNYGDKHNLLNVCDELRFDYTVPKIFKPKSYDEFCQFCEDIIKEEKIQGRIIEGVVVRTMYSNKLSCKYMNSEYDSKK